MNEESLIKNCLSVNSAFTGRIEFASSSIFLTCAANFSDLLGGGVIFPSGFLYKLSKALLCKLFRAQKILPEVGFDKPRRHLFGPETCT